MPTPVAARVRTLPAYPFAVIDEKVRALKEAGASPIDFGVGDPTLPTPALVRERGRAAMDERAASGYPSYIGDASYREAVAAWMHRRFGVSLNSATEITSTIGSKEGIFHFPLAFVNPGDVVLCPAPGYPPYARGTSFAGGTPYFLPLRRETGFLPDLDAIPEELAARARILWLNYPNSPSGAIAPASFLERAAAWGRARGILVVNDEAYTELYFGPAAPRSILEFGLEGVVSFQSMSKRSAMTGWRVGWTAGDASAIAAFRKVKTNIDSGTPTFLQDAAVAALADETHVAEARQAYRRKRDLLADTFVAMGLPDCRPAAAIYLWQRLPPGVRSVEFAERLLEREIAVVCTPGAWLSDACADGTNPGEGHVRFALVPSFEETREACARLREHKARILG
ncbi:MAG: aminotransferase class I/II-fold pyridoxal phosphate-dependent enzyme [Planctomycetaceae bacterium]